MLRNHEVPLSLDRDAYIAEMKNESLNFPWIVNVGRVFGIGG